MYLDGYSYHDDGNLGGWWTSLRDKIIKPVVRVAAGVYTGGASEMAYKAYEAAEAKKKQDKLYKAQMEAIKAQEAQYAAAGNAYPPSAYPPPAYGIEGRMTHQSIAPPSGAMQPYPAGPTQYLQPSAYSPVSAQLPAQPSAYVGPTPTAMTATPGAASPMVVQVAQEKMPAWVLPAGAGLAALVLVSMLSQQRR